MNSRNNMVEIMKRRILGVSQELSQYGAEVARDVREADGGLDDTVDTMKEGRRNE